LYDPATDEVEDLGFAAPSDGPAPRFRTAEQITVSQLRVPDGETSKLGQDSLFEVSLQTGEATEFLRLNNRVLSYAWNPDGTLLAYLLRAETATGLLPVALCVWEATTGRARLLTSITQPFGTATDQRQEERVSWSADGKYVLAVETTANPSMFVVDLSGHHVIKSKAGTFARWLNDDTLLYQRDPRDATSAWNWFELGIGGRSRRMGLPSEAFRPALSPDGKTLAFDDGEDSPSIFLYDIASGGIRQVASGFAAPIWLRSDLLAATAAGPANVGEIPWSAKPETSAISIDTGEIRRLSLPSTLAPSTEAGSVDVWLIP
jgi:WD40 repeat protein